MRPAELSAPAPRSRRGWLGWTLVGVLVVFGLLPLLLFVALLGSDAVGRWRFNAHSDAWREGIAREIPPGTSKARVLAFFATRGVPLHCGYARKPDACSARERRDFGVMPVWRLHFEATFRHDELVAVRQQARGIGF